ncbi:hypothetical protein AB4342_01385 [Vibrio breoganii]
MADLSQYTEEELFSKLRNSHDAGDGDAASRFASMIRDKRGETQVEPTTPATTGRWSELAANPTGNNQAWDGVAEQGSLEASFTDGVGQGLTFGFSDEILGGVRAAFGDETYTEARDDLREGMAFNKEANPWTYAGGEVTGALPLAARLPAQAWKAGGNVWGNLGRLGGEGAVYGGLYGLGTSEGETLGEIGTDVAKDAGIGAVVNPLGGAALRGLGRLFTRDERAIATDQAFGVTSTLAERYPKFFGRMQNLLDNTSGGAVAAKRVSDQYVEDARIALRNLVDGDGDAQTIGASFISSKNDWQEAHEILFREGFEDIRKAVNLDGKITPSNSMAFLSSERSAFGGADDIANIVEIPSIKRLRKALEDGEDVSLDALWKLRQELGDSITTGKFGVDDISQAKAKALYANVSEDLYDGVFRHSDDLTASQFVNLNEEYRDFQNLLDDIQPIFAKSNREPHSPEKVSAELVKRLRDEPSTLAPLKNITNQFGGSATDDAASGVLYQTSLNRGEVDPSKALERYNISRSKSGGEELGDIYPNPFTIAGVTHRNSPARNLTDKGVWDYETAMHLSRRAQDAVERGAATDAKQLVTSGAIPALAGFAGGGAMGAFLAPLATNAATYLLRRGMSNEAAAKSVDSLIRGLQDGSVSAEQLRLFNTIMAADSEAFSEF